MTGCDGVNTLPAHHLLLSRLYTAAREDDEKNEWDGSHVSPAWTTARSWLMASWTNICGVSTTTDDTIRMKGGGVVDDIICHHVSLRD